jgi:hypothetical protein
MAKCAGQSSIITITERLHQSGALFCTPNVFVHPCLVASLKGFGPNLWIDKDLVAASATSARIFTLGHAGCNVPKVCTEISLIAENSLGSTLYEWCGQSVGW